MRCSGAFYCGAGLGPALPDAILAWTWLPVAPGLREGSGVTSGTTGYVVPLRRCDTEIGGANARNPRSSLTGGSGASPEITSCTYHPRVTCSLMRSVDRSRLQNGRRLVGDDPGDGDGDLD